MLKTTELIRGWAGTPTCGHLNHPGRAGLTARQALLVPEGSAPGQDLLEKQALRFPVWNHRGGDLEKPRVLFEVILAVVVRDEGHQSRQDCSLGFPGAASRGRASTCRQEGDGRRLPGSLGPLCLGCVCGGWGRGIRSFVQARFLPTSATGGLNCNGGSCLSDLLSSLADGDHTCLTNSEPVREGGRHVLDRDGRQGCGGGARRIQC